MNTIKWHSDNLYNMKKTLVKEHEILEKQNRAVIKLSYEISFLEYQIQEARDIGKDKFDSTKFRIRKAR